jgi:hypothetical protein
MSTQREAQEKVSQKGHKYYAPIRNQANAVALKSLFLDIDFKGGDHGYDNADEAIAALVQFLKDTHLPRPTMMVASGGGIHAHWCLVKPLLPAEWQPLAYALAEATKKHGLKCDQQVTIDSARILRVAGTFNMKTGKARPVTLAGKANDFDYSNERIEKALEPYKTTTPSHPLTLTTLPARPAVQGLSDLAVGVDVIKALPIQVSGVVGECGFIKEALKTGGAKFTNPLWNLTTLLGTFMDDGRRVAHLMARKHPGYTQESTDELYDRKEREKQQKNLGWPSCQTISASGGSACQMCKHFGAGKSPLNFATRSAAALPPGSPAAPGNTGVAVSTPDWDLPAGYIRLPTGVIALIHQDLTLGTTNYIPVCDYPMTAPWVQSGSDGPTLHFKTKINKGSDSWVSLPFKIANGPEMKPRLQSQSFMLPYNPKVFGSFLVSWINKLQESRESVHMSSFGWNINSKTKLIEGFVFGGELWTPNGSIPSAASASVLFEYYGPSGDKTKWDPAAKIITNQKRPELDALLVSAFAAPLVRFCGQTGVLIASYSIDSGKGKSTTLKVAQAVWGDPVQGMQGLDDTTNSAMGQTGELHSLPLYWDELKTTDQMAALTNMVYRITGTGRDKRRMDRSAKIKASKTFETLLISASNESLIDFAESTKKLTDATLLRIFEFEVPSPDLNGPGRISSSHVSRTVAQLHNHYGGVGLEYAKWLGANHQRIDAEMGAYLLVLEKEVKALEEERFWTTGMATLLMGAKYANEQGYVSVDEAALKAFLIETLGKLRVRRAERPNDLKLAINAIDILTQFIKSQRPRHLLVTNRCNVAGKPAAHSINILNDAGRIESVSVQVGKDDKIMRISNYKLREWLADMDYPVFKVMQAFKEAFSMKTSNGMLGSGTRFSGTSEYLQQIDLSGHPGLDFTGDF